MAGKAPVDMQHSSSKAFRFSVFEVDLQSQELRKNGRNLSLPPQAFRVLEILLTRAGQLVTREDIRQAIWNDTTFVDFEHSINKAVRQVREALADNADSPRFVETLPRRGYRFIAELQIAASDPTPSGAVAARPKPFSAMFGVLAVCALAVVALGLWWQHYVKQEAEFHRLQIQGNFFISRFTEADIRKGIEYHKRAIALNPGSASAYDGLAIGWNLLSDLYAPPHEAMPKAKAAALEAVRLDDGFAPAHVSLGLVKLQYDWDWAGAEKEFRRAIELRPSSEIGHRMYGWLLIALGRFKEAQAEMSRPLETEPLEHFNLMELGLSYYFARQYEPALEQCRRAIGIDPTSYWSHMLLGWTYEQQRDFPSAIEAFNRANRLNDSSQVIASLGHAYAVAGRRLEAEKVISELQKKSERTYVSPYDVATIYAGLGDQEQTFAWLEKAYEDRSGWLPLWLKVDPKFDAIRSDRRFQGLLRRIGFTS